MRNSMWRIAAVISDWLAILILWRNQRHADTNDAWYREIVTETRVTIVTWARGGVMAIMAWQPLAQRSGEAAAIH